MSRCTNHRVDLPDGSKTNFFRGVRSGLVRATARTVHIGKRTIVVQTDVLNEQDRSIALVIQTQAVLQQA
jgi:1,4-dihydroxy-2-naphthoyl-CoA hydrolase